MKGSISKGSVNKSLVFLNSVLSSLMNLVWKGQGDGKPVCEHPLNTNWLGQMVTKQPPFRDGLENFSVVLRSGEHEENKNKDNAWGVPGG